MTTPLGIQPPPARGVTDTTAWRRSEPGDIGRAIIHLSPAVVVSAKAGTFFVSTAAPGIRRMDEAGLRQWCEFGGYAVPTPDDLAWVQA